jgi:hypothetical protein
MAWGWKEHTDHRVFFAWSAEFALSLVECTAVISFGIQFGPALAKLEGKIEGAKAELKTKFDINTPDDPVRPDVKTAISIPVVLQGRAAFDLLSLRFERAAGARTGFTGEGGARLSAQRKFQFYAEIKWAGVDLFVLKRSPSRGEEQDVYHVWGEQPLYSGTFPKGA